MIETTPLADISITRVVSEAGVTRPTFYQQFPDILAAARVAAFRRLETAFPFPKPLLPGTVLTTERVRDCIVKQAEPLFEHLAAHRAFYVSVMDEAGTAGFFDELIDFTAARLLPEAMAASAGSPERVAITTKFFAGGLTWLTIRWLRDDTTSSAAVMSRQVADLVANFIGGVVSAESDQASQQTAPCRHEEFP
ncbi:TetR-like C-terminal domain-containing protein [Pedomonas mirosovicensis]|uniref:TetR-like C-terminal domain-containing protein n=1 Tax=Pedomonas mirosovicensis TaxID=2908641 RepID=UPI0021675F4D|nr:TetR-like C-terminal domain-containing protein [Pedomonas mirosovicensis]MCH8686701.1 TetR family transcriptional regulator C-terminal domain-containing protein [Pedomonas mirosovicensis]